MGETSVTVCCFSGSVKNVVVTVAVIGGVLSLISTLYMFLNQKFSPIYLTYFVSCVFLIYGARSDRRIFLWPFIVFNLILFFINTVATGFVLSLFCYDKYEMHYDPPWIAIVIVVYLILSAILNLILEYIIVVSYWKVASKDTAVAV